MGYVSFSVPLTSGVVIEVALANRMLTDRTQIEALSMLPVWLGLPHLWNSRQEYALGRSTPLTALSVSSFAF